MTGKETGDRGNRAAELVAGYRSLAGAEGDGGHRLDHLRQAEEQNERQHFRIFGAQQPRHQEVIERQSDAREHQEGDHDRRNGIEGKQREQPERQESAQHQKVAMRQIDDAHDAEHEVEPEPDQGEVEPEQQTGQQAVGEHSARSAAAGVGSRQLVTVTDAGKSACRSPDRAATPSPASVGRLRRRRTAQAE